MSSNRVGLIGAACDSVEKQKTPANAREVTPMGFELSQDSSGNTRVSDSRGNKSGNIEPDSGPSTPATPAKPTDPELATLVAAWPDLLPAIRAGVLALVNAANGPM